MAELTYRIRIPNALIINDHEAAEAAALGVSELIVQHLRNKNAGTPPRTGFPKSNYYAEASNDVQTAVHGKTATVTIPHEGLALHYEGGAVYPKKKALAIPLDPSVAGIWPSEYGGEMFVVWPKGKSSGLLVGADINHEGDIGKALYRLIYKATIPADPSVLPTDSEIEKAAEEYIWEAAS